MYIPLEELKKATDLTRRGRLLEATRAIRRALANGAAAGAAEPREPPPRPGGMAPAAQVVDVAWREVPGPATAQLPDPGESAPAPAARHADAAPTPAADAPQPGRFELHSFVSRGLAYPYRLYVPPRHGDAPLPVVVMLHGCTQDAADFATGTGMNALAAEGGCIVVYPEQRPRANSMRCWNWFEPAHQQRGRGEPAMIAALAQHVVAQAHGDPARVYVAGLSAGGAMAALLGQLYPDVFAAVGVHSGLPAAAAHDVRTAYAAMRRGARHPHAGPAAAVPTIVIHGRADRTVHPDNGQRLVDEALAQAAAEGRVLQPEEQRMTAGGRTVHRTVYRDAAGVPHLERWDIAGTAHAWSGGHAAGSHADPAGPSASAALLDFFLRHRLPPAGAARA